MSILGAWCSVLGAWCSVLGARCSMLGARCSVIGVNKFNKSSTPRPRTIKPPSPMPADNRAQFPANVILVRRTCRYEIDDKDKALMYITGGDNLDSPYHWKGNEDIELAIALSLAVKCVGIVLFQVPNQPIIFTDDVLRHKRSEDATIAFTWDHFHRHQNETEWLLRLPMVSWSPPPHPVPPCSFLCSVCVFEMSYASFVALLDQPHGIHSYSRC